MKDASLIHAADRAECSSKVKNLFSRIRIIIRRTTEGRSASNHIHQIHVYVKVHFNANNREQRAAVYLAEFSWLNFDEANNFINDFKKKVEKTTIIRFGITK